MNTEETNAVDLLRLLKAVRSRAWIVILASVLSMAVAFSITFFFVTPKYEASAKFYVNNSSASVGGSSGSMSSGDLSTSRNLVDSYIVILNTRETFEEVIKYSGETLTVSELKNMITAGAVDDTEIVEITVTSASPEQAENIANAIAYVLPQRITTIIEGTSAKVVEEAVFPTGASSPSYVNNTVIGMLLGLVISVGAIVLWEIFDTTIREEDDIAGVCKYPVLAAVPDMFSSSQKGGCYGYGNPNGSNQTKKVAKSASLVGEDISFSASEAYKLLRTKLQFSFSDEKNSHVIAVSSSLKGEGKSLTSVNLAYSLAKLGKKVILIDCDMRIPTLAEKLKIQNNPGLSDYLTRQCNPSELIKFGENCGKASFPVITAGHIPPNPVELLSSDRMKALLDALRKYYEYIILDLPPICEVSDAVVVSEQADGVLLVARRNNCDRNVLAYTIAQLEYVHAKILGVVFNAASENGGKGYYKKYYGNSKKTAHK